MFLARQKMHICRSRPELDTQPTVTWDEHITPLFIDETFQPFVVDGLDLPVVELVLI